MTQRFSRRSFLHATAATSGIALLAGCSGSSGGDGGSDGDSEATDSPAPDREMPAFDGWFERTGNYDGVHDMTGEDEVTISVGAEGNGGGFAFGPAAVKVSTGTTVVWEWTGNGGTHNVLHREGEFESELTASEGFTFEHTFDATGEYRYVCVPHETLGMVGIVLVE
ncbi:halocyanin domain-containing protein [Haloferax sp. MBLA0076]|uniref:Halocyanin domain-containing protein n=1 Tax=Haloferax litoreum TaxID=2666140 RepID=A0A6A8GN45_9EURY|nr:MULTISPECIES: halocyanin domain-containing protein [Haloferax]KAB1194660.1 halocyanin domain-containing protein [Haloferax sp. CBA1148]MRX23240.1 halocyanin domain-containing protein [Haloferax litoreum]